jgi:hypothetical protein
MVNTCPASATLETIFNEKGHYVAPNTAFMLKVGEANKQLVIEAIDNAAVHQLMFQGELGQLYARKVLTRPTINPQPSTLDPLPFTLVPKPSIINP